MSIWATTYWLDVPKRDQYGRDEAAVEEWNNQPDVIANMKHGLTANGGFVDVANSGMSTLIRLSVGEEPWGGEVCLSADEARQVAEALLAAAENANTPQP